MSLDRGALDWKGWGRTQDATRFTPARERHLLDALGERLGRRLEETPSRVTLAEVKLPQPRLSEAFLAGLRKSCGDARVHVDTATRTRCALGRSLPDLFRLRRGELEVAPDAVVTPGDEGAVLEVLRLASDAGVAVVPVGGATSVVGGVEARAGDQPGGVVALDTTRLDAVVRIEPEGGLATFGAGIDGPALEAALAARGLTLGHFPQSFEYSTLGGWIATRSTGQQSNGYGGIEDLVVALRVATPKGILSTSLSPRSATGPDLKELALGSEGTLGVIVEATVRVSPAPRFADDRAMVFHSFADGVAAAREMVQRRAGLGLLRLSDAAESELALVQRHDPERRFDPTALAFGALSRFGWGEGRAMLLYGAEGPERGPVRAALGHAQKIGRARGGFPLGRSAGRHWRRERFKAPHLRDWLLDHGVAVDTFETAFPWRDLEAGHAAVTGALAEAAQRHAGGGYAMGHLSHSYLDGACLYFTVLYPVDASREVSQWTSLKRDVTDAILAAGGTLSHHHGVGADHRPWMEAEKGALGLETLRALKASLDPSGVMNPGKLL